MIIFFRTVLVVPIRSFCPSGASTTKIIVGMSVDPINEDLSKPSKVHM